MTAVPSPQQSVAASAPSRAPCQVRPTLQLRRSVFVALLFTLLCGAPAAAALAGVNGERAWTLLDDEGGIQVYRRDVPGSNLYEFRGVGTVDASMAKIVAVLSDASKLPAWVDGCIEGKLVEKNYDEHDLTKEPSTQNTVFYGVNKAPWPLQNRDFVLRSSLTMNPAASGRPAGITIVSKTITHQAYPAKDGLVRLSLMNATIQLTPVAAGKTSVDFAVVVDPGGIVPNVVINVISHDLPMKTLAALAELVKVSDYNRAVERLVEHHFKAALKNVAH